jgi:hypothetical protein
MRCIWRVHNANFLNFRIVIWNISIGDLANTSQFLKKIDKSKVAENKLYGSIKLLW